MKEYDEQIEKRLNRLGSSLRLQPSVAESSMSKIEQTEQAKPLGSPALMQTLVKSAIGLAACLLVGAFLWLFLNWTTSITLADVQKSIDSKAWILISFEDGSQRWANLKEQRSFYTRQDDDGGNFYAGMRDHIYGIWRYYHSNWGQQIHEQSFITRPYPQTPWEYALGDWDDRGIEHERKTIEKFNDTIEGRNVVRFDTYNVGPLGLRSLAQQVWADPKTRLPLRIRLYSGPDKYDTGDFSFPQTGPASIYDLGAPEGLDVVTNWGVEEPAAKAVLDAAEQARQRLPLKMRIIEKSKYTLSISYRCGNKFRSESYGKTTANNNDLIPLDLPEDNNNIHEWASDNLTLFDLCIFDSRYEYSYKSGQAPWDSSQQPGEKLNVEYQSNDWINALIPIREQWPYTSNVGPMKVLENEAGTPPGCILLQYEGLGLCRHWYIDPERDYICVKQLEWRNDKKTGQYKNTLLVERSDLTRLSSGQWYARTIKRSDATATEFDVTLLSDYEMELLTGKNDSNGFFDGEKLLKQVLDEGIDVTFWAR